MPVDSVKSPGHLLQELLEQWRHQYRKRAEGGWWSLAGFSFQASVFLLRFFQQLENGTTEPGQLAEMEQVSDILCPNDGRLTLIQVKRTLDRPRLVAALEEAYLITNLCRRETPALLGRLRFQIACRKKDTPLNVSDLTMSDVIQTQGDSESWQAMLRQFDELNPIMEQPDTLDQLHLYLWNLGVQDTTLLIQQCAGRMLNSFDMPGPDAIRALGRDLRSLFFAATRRSHWARIGHVLILNDISSDGAASKDKRVLTGQVPKFEHLRRGYFRDRQQIFQSLWTAFTGWLSTLNSSEFDPIDKIPVFWISGRSGEGKSVLLLQLIAEFLKSTEAAPTLQLKSGNDLPRLIETAPERFLLSDPAQSRIFAVIDDAYDLHDREGWGDEIGNACSLRTPPLAVITCGPTEQLEQFTSLLNDQFDVDYFEVPKFDIEEGQEFIEWYETRTGQSRDLSTLTRDNTLLVLFMFELAQGMKLPEFARRFRRRLAHLGLLETVRTIVAVNALYMDAPLDLIPTNESRDTIERLCEEDQLHFRITGAATGSSRTEGVRIAHAHLAWLLFVEWVEPPTTLAKAWARELAKALAIMESELAGTDASNLLNRLLHTAHASDSGTGERAASAANRLELVRETYRLNLLTHGGRPNPRTLPRWLDFQYKISALELAPDPAECAVVDIFDELRAPLVHASVGIWLWRISESRPPSDARRMQDAAMHLFKQYPDNPGLVVALCRLYGMREGDRKFATDWLAANEKHPQAYLLLAALVAGNPTDAAVIKQASDWLAANENHTQAYHVLAPLVAGNPTDAAVIRQASDWLAANERHPQAYHVLAALVAGNPTDAAVIKQASDWLAANEKHRQAYQLLAPLVAGNPTDAAVIKQASDWLTANEKHPQAYWLLAALVAGNPTDAAVIKQASDWLAANEKHPQAYHVLAPLVAGNPIDAAVIKQASDWLAANEKHTQAYHVLAPLVAGNPTDAAMIKQASDWLAANEKHPQAYWLLAPLVAGNPTDAAVIKQASDWLAANEKHTQAYWLLAALVAGNPTDAAVIKLAGDWLAANEEHPQAYWLLKTMIPRTDGAEEWLNKGEVYVKRDNCRHPESILAVLLTGGKAAPRFVETALDYIGGPAEKRHRDFVLINVSRALVHNFDNAVQYLAGPYDEKRKRTVQTSIALGMKRYPDTISAFVNDAVNRISPENTYNILRNVVVRNVEADELDTLLARWLSHNYRRRGYGGMLDALGNSPERWRRMAAVGLLGDNVVRDVKARSARP